MLENEEESTIADHLVKGVYRISTFATKSVGIGILSAAVVSGAPGLAMMASTLQIGYGTYGASTALSTLTFFGGQVLYHPRASYAILVFTSGVTFCIPDLVKIYSHFSCVFGSIGGVLGNLVFHNRDQGDQDEIDELMIIDEIEDDNLEVRIAPSLGNDSGVIKTVLDFAAKSFSVFFVSVVPEISQMPLISYGDEYKDGELANWVIVQNDDIIIAGDLVES